MGQRLSSLYDPVSWAPISYGISARNIFHALKLHLMEGQTFISKGCRYKELSSLHGVYKDKKSKMVR